MGRRLRSLAETGAIVRYERESRRVKPLPLALRAFVCALAMLAVAAPAQALPVKFVANYLATARGMTVGQAKLQLERSGDSYLYRSTIQATGLAKLLFSGNILETSSGTLNSNGLRPARYDYQRTGSGEREDKIRFAANGEESLLHYKGTTRQAELPAEALDPLSLHIALMNDVAAGKQRMRYLVAEPRRLKAYEVVVTGRERIRTGSGTIDAVRVDVVGSLKLTPGQDVVLDQLDIPAAAGGVQTSFWLAPDLDYLMVRIRHVDHDEGSIGIELQGVEVLQTADTLS